MGKNKISIGHLSTCYHSNFILMQDDDLKTQLGVEVDWNIFGTGPEMVAAFKNNELDIGYIGLPPAIIGIEQGVPIKCVAGGHVEGTILCAKKKYKDDTQLDNNLHKVLSQFKGAAIGVPAKGSIHDVILSYYIDKYKLQDEIEVINYAQAELIALDMKKNKLEAGVGTPCLAVFAATLLESRLIIRADNLWDNNPSYGVFFHEDLIKKNPELVLGFLTLHKKSATLLRKSPDLAAKLIANTVEMTTEEYVKEVLKISPKYCI
ncbi:MAG: ABC transporter substrate-binding protein, partial [Desulfobacterales bacterium]|nr:ABC transporter substrate-binding protein [Desulfobacterales bacterium]